MTCETVPDDVWAAWLEHAARLNEHAPPVRTPAGPGRPGTPAGEDSPGSDFNRRGSWDEAGLFDAGWAWCRQPEPGRGLLTRPGKDGGVSASAGMVSSKENGWPLFYCWSTSAPDFVPEQCYTRFAVFATLRHGGDFAAAAKDLVGRGYGHRMPDPVTAVVGPVPAAEPQAPGVPEDPADKRVFRWMSELRFRPQNDKWLWDGFLSRGGITLLNALWKAGKSTLLAHLLRAFDGRKAEFLARPITPSRVLYVSEEHEDLWAERRDELGIGDHVGIVTRDALPFRGRASPADWVALLTRLGDEADKHRFDVVILDTISKLWPVREENDAGQVEDALMPLWGITARECAVLLVHHNRKSDGKDFTGARGSGGLPAFVETIMEFRRFSESHKDHKRVITSAGRYRETPPKLLIELLSDGYVSHGDPDEMDADTRARVGVGDQEKADAWKAAVLAALPAAPPGMTRKGIHAALRNRKPPTPVRDETLRDWLNKRTDDGELERGGDGTPAKPFRWYRVSDDFDGESCPGPSCPAPGESTGHDDGTQGDDE